MLDLLIGAMRAGSAFEDVMYIERAGPIMMRNFVKGSAGELLTQRARGPCAVLFTHRERAACLSNDARWPHS